MVGPPVVVLAPTASGKSELAMAAAHAVGGTEIVAVDAMQVYRGMDIGTAKPTPADQAAVPHHGIDLVEPTVDFTVADYRAAYDRALTTIAGRPLLVAGTGLYLAAAIDRLDMPGQWPEVRRDLDAEPDVAALWRRLDDLDPVAAARIEPGNRRRVVRALEVTVGGGRPFSSYGPGLQAYPPTAATMIGLRWPRPRLAERIERRVTTMIEAGLLDEVAGLHAAGMSKTARQALGYKELSAHLDGRAEARRGGGRHRPTHPPVRRPPRAVVPSRPARTLVRRRSRPGRRAGAGPDLRTAGMTRLTLTKHHGLGNDFLVAFEPGAADLPALARRLCDRRRGIGADGLLIGESVDGFTARMVLYNADGSRAEMSGNGIRCFAQALATRRGDLAAQDILTDAGPRHVVLQPAEDPLTILAAVDMGAVGELTEPAGWAAIGTNPDRPVAHLDLGNPHTVVGVDDVRAVDLLALGRQVPQVNLEVIEAGPERDAITIRVHERGAGITEACGTGAAASAWAAARWRSRRRRRGRTGRAHGRRRRQSGAPPSGTRPCHADRPGHLHRHDRDPLRT